MSQRSIRGAPLFGLLIVLWGMTGCGGETPQPVTPTSEEQPPPSTPPPSTPPVLVSEAAAAAAACPHGGTTVRSGTDVNGSGVLDAAEVQRTTHVCFPAPPEAPPRTLVRLDAVAAGAECAEGGTAVRSGLDLDRSGELETAEVQHTDLICRERLLTRLDVEPAGGRCPDQGVALSIGRDLDGNGQLEDAEVVAVEVECSDVLARDVRVSTETELRALAPIRAIVGRLDVSSTQLSEVSLPQLVTVSGALTVSSNGALTKLSLPSLDSVGGNFRVDANPLLEVADLSSLKRVQGELALRSTRLANLSQWARLESTRGFTLEHNAQLTSLAGLAALRSVQGPLTVTDNDQLSELKLFLWDDVGVVAVRGNAALTLLQLHVDGLWSPNDDTTGAVYVTGNLRLTTVWLESDSHQGSVVISENPALTRVTLNAQAIEGSLQLTDDPALVDVWMFDLERIAGSVTVRAPVEHLYFAYENPSVVLGSLTVEGSRLTMYGRDMPLVSGSTLLRDNPLLLEVDLWRVGGSFAASGNALLREVGLWVEAVPGSISVSGNPSLTSLAGLQWIKHIGGSLYVSDNPRLVRTNMHQLETVAGSLTLSGNPLVELGLYRLTEVGKDVRIVGTALTRWSGMTALKTIGDGLVVYGNATLEDIRLPLVSGSQYLQVSQNPLLETLDLPAYRFTSSAFVWSNAQLPTCEVDRFFAQLPTGASTHQEGNDPTGLCP